VLCVGAPVLTGHWVGGHEGYSYLWRAAEVSEQLAGGTLWPRWCPDFYWGFGYPFFVFYPPGVFLAASAIAPLTPGLWWALGIVAMAGSACLFYGTRRLALLFVGEDPARVAAVLASLATYRFAQLWVRGDYAESVAAGLMPWVLAEAVLLGRGGERQAMRAAGARLAMGLALMCFTHTLTAVMACGALAAMGLWTARGGGLVRLGLPAVSGLILSAAYWIPVAVQAPLVRLSDMVDPVPGSPSYHWGDHFPTLGQRLWSGFGFGDSVPGGGDGMSLATSLVGWGVVVVALTLLRRADTRGRLLPLLAAWLGVQALLLPVSSMLWRWLPGLAMFQFPWRFLVLDGLLVALIGAVVVEELGGRWPALVGGLGAAAALPIAVLCVQHAAGDPYPLGPVARAALQDPARLQTLGAFSEASMHIPLTTAGRNEYLPRSVTRPPAQHPASEGAPPSPRNLGPPREQSGAAKTWAVRVPEAGVYEVSWFAFPGVVAAVNGVPTEVTVSAEGLVQVPLRAGEHIVRVEYAGTGDQRIGAVVGAIGWVLALGILGARRRRGPPPSVSRWAGT